MCVAMVCCAMSEFGLFQQDAVLSASLSRWAGRRSGIIAAHWKAATRVSRPAQSSAQPEAQHWHAGLSGVIGDSSIEQMSEESSLQDKLKQHKCQLIFKGEMFSVRLSAKGDGWESCFSFLFCRRPESAAAHDSVTQEHYSPSADVGK